MKLVRAQQPELEIVANDVTLRYIQHGPLSNLVRWHYHPEYELHMMISGYGKVFIGDYIGNFRQGQIYLTGPNLPHNWISSENSLDDSADIRDKLVQFKQSTIDSLADSIPEFKNVQRWLASAAYGLKFNRVDTQLFEPLFDELRDSTGLEQLANFLKLINLLMKEPVQQKLSSKDFQSTAPSTNSELINRALAYIEKNYRSEIRLDSVAKHVGNYSASSFSRFFRNTTGMTYTKFVTRLRISKACEKLEFSDEPITQICFSAGFTNIANFNRHFRAEKNMTPMQYRVFCREKHASV